MNRLVARSPLGAQHVDAEARPIYTSTNASLGATSRTSMAGPIQITRRVLVPEAAIHVTAARASGPGGQNVNKVASKVDVHVDLSLIVGLDDAARARLRALAGRRIGADGTLHVVSQRTRDQLKNLGDALETVRQLVLAATVVPRPRRATRPTRGSVERRLEHKRKSSDKKRARGRVDEG